MREAVCAKTISGEISKGYQKIGNHLLFGLPLFCYYRRP